MFASSKTRKSCNHVFQCREHLLRLKSRSNFPLARPTVVAAAFLRAKGRALELQFPIL